MRVAAAGIGVLVACLCLLGSFFVAAPMTLPMVQDRHLTLYQAVARSTTPQIDWRELLAVDAVRLKQDFSQVTRESVERTAQLFVVCHSESKTWDMALTFETVGETWSTNVVLSVPSSIRTSTAVRSGRVQVEVLDGLDHPVGGSGLEPGAYAVRVTAVEVPADVTLTVTEEQSEPTCYGRPMAEVMAELGFSPDDVAMAQEILKSFEGREHVLPPPQGGGYVWPAEGPITSPFGYRVDPTTGEWSFHTGVDIGVPVGTPVRAAAAGVVTFVGWNGGYGQAVIIDHGPFTTIYGHLSRYYYAPGTYVAAGQVVAESGNTGRSTGPHLHFEWRIDGTPVDPLQFY